MLIGDIDEQPLAHAAADSFLTARCDVRHRRDHERLRDAALDAFGQVDLIGLNAGVAPTGPVATTAESTWRWLFEVNVLGVAHGVAVFAPLLVEQGHGHILITASIAGLVPSPGFGAYAASKHAVIGMGNTLRSELEPAGVGVTILCPGFVDTDVFSSERNRPEELRGESHPDPSIVSFVAEMAAAAELSADDVAERAIAGVRERAPFVLPNAELDPAVLDRDADLRTAMER